MELILGLNETSKWIHFVNVLCEIELFDGLIISIGLLLRLFTFKIDELNPSLTILYAKPTQRNCKHIIPMLQCNQYGL